MKKTIKAIVIFAIIVGMMLILGKVSLAASSSTDVVSIKIKSNSGSSGTIDLVLGAHETEKLTAEALNS